MTDIDIDKILNDPAGNAGPAKGGDSAAAPVFSVPAQSAAAVKAEPAASAPAAEAPAPVAPAEPAQPPAEAKPEAAADTVSADQTPIAPAPKDAKAEAPAEASLNEVNKLRIIGKALRNVEKEIANVIRLLESNAPVTAEASAAAEAPATAGAKNEELSAALRSVEGRVLEGVFDGQNMVGSDGKIYTVPANYASKSKLVEGDMLKLTITPKGSFIYKQIGPIERSRVIGNLGFDPTIGEFYATTENRRWSILKASVTYYKGDPGDEVVLLVPKNAPSKWAAVENIIKHNPLT